MLSAYSVPLTVYGCRAWSQSFTVVNEDGSPVDLSVNTSGRIVLPSGPGGCGAVPAVQNWTPSVNVNVASFAVPDGDMGALMAGAPYAWQFISASSSAFS